jgi:hypothetical protein
MTFTKSKVLIIGRRYSRNFKGLPHQEAPRPVLHPRGRAAHEDLCFRFFRFVLAGIVTRYIILGCMRPKHEICR